MYTCFEIRTAVVYGRNMRPSLQDWSFLVQPSRNSMLQYMETSNTKEKDDGNDGGGDGRDDRAGNAYNGNNFGGFRDVVRER